MQIKQWNTIDNIFMQRTIEIIVFLVSIFHSRQVNKKKKILKGHYVGYFCSFSFRKHHICPLPATILNPLI